MIANLDLVRVFVQVTRRQDLVVDLFTFGDDVERIADLHAHIFILRCVVDLVLTDELLISLVVLLVKTNGSGRQRHAELVRLRIAKLYVHANLLFDRLTRIAVVRVVVMLAAQHELFLHIKPSRFQQRHLLGFVVANRRRPLKRVHVILKEALFLKLRFIHRFLSCHHSR